MNILISGVVAKKYRDDWKPLTIITNVHENTNNERIIAMYEYLHRWTGYRYPDPADYKIYFKVTRNIKN